MTTANVYQQRPTTGAKAESSLHHADLASLVGKGRKNAGVIVREKKLLGHLTIRGDLRFDHSNEKPFFNGADASANQFTIGLNFISLL